MSLSKYALRVSPHGRNQLLSGEVPCIENDMAVGHEEEERCMI
jgi:hypothetical protein